MKAYLNVIGSYIDFYYKLLILSIYFLPEIDRGNDGIGETEMLLSLWELSSIIFTSTGPVECRLSLEKLLIVSRCLIWQLSHRRYSYSGFKTTLSLPEPLAGFIDFKYFANCVRILLYRFMQFSTGIPII